MGNPRRAGGKFSRTKAVSSLSVHKQSPLTIGGKGMENCDQIETAPTVKAEAVLACYLAGLRDGKNRHSRSGHCDPHPPHPLLVCLKNLNANAIGAKRRE